MFTLEQIKAAHSKVKSGEDFPAYIKQLKQLGVTDYEAYVADGHTIYYGPEADKIVSEPKYADIMIADHLNKEEFQSDLKGHQQGKTDFPTFCSDCARSGIAKWIVRLDNMTCTYYSKMGEKVLIEQIPEID